VLAAAARAEVEELKQALASYLERNAIGNEERLGELLADADLSRARAILLILARSGTQAAKAALKRAEKSPLPELRVEAVAVRASVSPEGLRDELARLSADPDMGVRMAALRTMARYKVKEAGPPLVQYIQSSAFHKLSRDERQLALATLHELSPSRAELLAIELFTKSVMITREAVDDTRIAAIELLEKTAASRDALGALEKTAGKWSNSSEVRAAAGRAAAAVRARMQATR
jgi:HEAT repeat protein